MNRRTFLKKTAIAAGTLAALPYAAKALDELKKNSVKNVHVIFKTHLDIGFTDLAENVIKRYFENYIPAALTLAEKSRIENPKQRFIWTTGSWLIYQYLKDSTADNKRRMENAIKAGDIAWHGLPFTTHSELADDSLFTLGTSLSSELDKRFGRKTIAAKMTDVPGHCRGIVPIMHKAGLVFLHIGVNPASTPPDVPEFFIWKTGGSELIVMYQHEYGKTAILPDGQTAAAICFTGDNQGPQSTQQIAAVYQDLQNRFPGANIFASTLDAVAAKLMQIEHTLPIITQEIGDTWIHGPGSDPKLIAQFRELTRLRNEWIKDGRIKERSQLDIDFGSKMLLVAEHTWGMDIKTHLNDWSNYTLDELAAARKTLNFQNVEASWLQKRAFLTKAINVLPEELSQEASKRFEILVPKQNFENKNFMPYKGILTNENFDIDFDKTTGAINYLKDNKNKRTWATEKNSLALFGYQTFSQDDYDRFFNQYVTHQFDWAIDDFGKTGIKDKNAKSQSYQPRLKDIKICKYGSCEKIIIWLNVPEAENTGCPAEIIETISLPENKREIEIELSWFNKRAFRIPEAIWFSFVTQIDDVKGYSLDKMNHRVSPLDIVRNGNRNLHGIIKGVNYTNKNGGFQIDSLDAFLVAPGRKSLLNFDNLQPDMNDGVHFCLFNNVWGTNFTMWFEEDMKFRFKLIFS